ncbi:hypothetical protein NEIFLAOT_00478 [Neisseria flavescens NRL30031/H210]|uniref:Uncharacterized protein n=1 Tax=Neisseria flavescens NRL30031/H210 TaxID=546264 RepID=C0EKN4_NEIFL|nr:hypothetical protein NEIFLAOT_00478 [Neisseria flavescens NRL30031/H210]
MTVCLDKQYFIKIMIWLSIVILPFKPDKSFLTIKYSDGLYLLQAV